MAGAAGQAAYDFADFLNAAGQAYWQLCRWAPRASATRPTQSFPSFAGNPYFIDPDLLSSYAPDARRVRRPQLGHDPRHVDYGKIYASRFTLLHKAYKRAALRATARPSRPLRRTMRGWLPNYALFMASSGTSA